MTKSEAVKWIKAIKDKYIHGGDESYDEKRKEALDMAIQALESQKWIPVSERLPEEDDKEYLVTMYSGGVYDVDTSYFWYFEEGYSDWGDCGVIAWMPLPEPYKEG